MVRVLELLREPAYRLVHVWLASQLDKRAAALKLSNCTLKLTCKVLAGCERQSGMVRTRHNSSFKFVRMDEKLAACKVRIITRDI